MPPALEIAEAEKKGGLFVRFPTLPAELREHIWKDGLPEGSMIHEVRIEEEVESDHCQHGSGGVPATAAHPVLLRVCKESRQIALNRYTLVLARRSAIHEACKPRPPEPLWTPWELLDKELTTDDPGVVEHFDYLTRSHATKTKIMGIKTDFNPRSYVDLEQDTVYFNRSTFAVEHICKPEAAYVDLEYFHWYIEPDCTQKIKHLAVDFEFWRSDSSLWDYKTMYSNPERQGDPKLNDTEFRLWMLMDFHNTFTNIETLTIVTYDHGQYKYKKKFQGKNDIGPLEFVDHVDIGPYKRPGRSKLSLGPWYGIGWSNGAITDPRSIGGTDSVYTHIENLKAEIISDVAELRSKKPHIRIPEIKWKYALRNGKLNTY